jgi:transcriptional regulator with PAS, ATPase and Fis domain
MLSVYEHIKMAAKTPVPVLICGETGTGKELVARAIHHLSEREGPFVAINCAAVVETLIESELFGHEKGAFTGACQQQIGRFEQAHRGTLFLDEISEATPAFQAKLLRVLDEGTFERVGGRQPLRSDARLIATTNRNLRDWIDDGNFRDDLYYRLSVVTLDIPPLRERTEDLPLLADYLLQRIVRKIDTPVPMISDTALSVLQKYHWPGNVRELENVLTRACLACQGVMIQVRDIDFTTNTNGNGSQREATLRAIEYEHIIRVLETTRWHYGKACEVLGISRPTLRKKLRAYGGRNGQTQTHEGGTMTYKLVSDWGSCCDGSLVEADSEEDAALWFLTHLGYTIVETRKEQEPCRVQRLSETLPFDRRRK